MNGKKGRGAGGGKRGSSQGFSFLSVSLDMFRWFQFAVSFYLAEKRLFSSGPKKISCPLAKKREQIFLKTKLVRINEYHIDSTLQLL